jgi:hypothetical protein
MTPAQPALDAMMEGVTALLENVTPGPWSWNGDPVQGASLFGLAGQAVISYAGYEGMWFSVYDVEADAANARFIAAARELVPALAAEVRAQRETIAGLTAVRDMLGEWWAKEKARAEAAEATIAGLTARVEALTGALQEALYGLSWAKAQIASADAAQKMPPREHPPIDRARASVSAALTKGTPDA